MIPRNALVKLVCVNFFKRGNFILYLHQLLILNNDFRGRVLYSGQVFCLVDFTYPFWFPFAKNYTINGLITLWVKHEDLKIVSLDFVTID